MSATFRDDTGEKTVTVAEGPTVVGAMVATTDNGSVMLVGVFHFDGLEERQIALVLVPSTAGTASGVAGVDLLNDVDSPWMEVDERGNNILRLREGESLRVAVSTAPAAGKRLDVVALCREKV